MRVISVIGIWFLMLVAMSFFLLHDKIQPSVIIPFVVPIRVAQFETAPIPSCAGRERKSPTNPASGVSGVSVFASAPAAKHDLPYIEPVPPAPSASPREMPFPPLPVLDVEPQAPSTETITPIPPLEIERVGLTSELLSTVPVVYASGLDGFGHGHGGEPSRPVSVPEPPSGEMVGVVIVIGGLIARKGKTWKS